MTETTSRTAWRGRSRRVSLLQLHATTRSLSVAVVAASGSSGSSGSMWQHVGACGNACQRRRFCGYLTRTALESLSSAPPSRAMVTTTRHDTTPSPTRRLQQAATLGASGCGPMRLRLHPYPYMPQKLRTVEFELRDTSSFTLFFSTTSLPQGGGKGGGRNFCALDTVQMEWMRWMVGWTGSDR